MEEITSLQDLEALFESGNIPAMFAAFYGIIIALAVWSTIWKGMGLWRSARLGEMRWFIAILVLNTAGILPIIYLLITRDRYAKLPQK